MPVKKGDKVKVDYEGALEDGTVFDTSDNSGTLEFEVGGREVLQGFENAIVGMEKGQEKEFTVASADAYGDHNPDLIQTVPKDRMPGEVEAGMLMMAGLQNGTQMPVKVVEVGEDTVTVDLNHPLTGKTLYFKVKVVDAPA
jgi:FKBP-type peptidyl-prolyl cis-trans isomerase 2